ncbi:MAG: patatin-like phospholipase family protein [Woeseiaceae bacterium]
MKDQHKLLSIDGGGIRGVLALELLDRLERDIAAAQGIPREEFRLSDFFDYVSGTSTGAVVAACIARGMPVSEIKDFYWNSGPDMFPGGWFKQKWSLLTKQSKFDAGRLEVQFKKMFGEQTTLEPGNLKCHLMCVTRNQSTDSPWPISSNPDAKYNRQDYAGSNLKIPLWQLVRASAAAPFVYQPEVIELDADHKFVFLDGGVTPYNNSAWQLFRMATAKEYNMNWPTGEDKLLLVSVGTGTSPKGDDGKFLARGFMRAYVTAKQTIGLLIQSMMVDQDTNCRQVGRCVHGAKLDAEIGDMIPRDGKYDPNDTYKNRIPLSQDLGRSFLYARYNVHLEQKELDRLGFSDVKAKTVQKLDSVKYIEDLKRIGARVAEDINVHDFAPFLKKRPF